MQSINPTVSDCPLLAGVLRGAFPSQAHDLDKTRQQFPRNPRLGNQPEERPRRRLCATADGCGPNWSMDTTTRAIA